MAQETVEGGDRILGGWGERWLFTLHSDQSFLSTPELHDSRIGTHPVGERTDIHTQKYVRKKKSHQEFEEFAMIMRD